jgi:Rrf2 family protein
LVRGGIIKATRGIHGGYALTVAAETLSVLDVVNAIDPVKRIRTCPIGLGGHAPNLCSLHRRLDAVLEQTEQSFGSTTIAELINCAGSLPLCEVAKSA